MIERKSLRQMWSTGAETLGAWLSVPSVVSAEAAASCDVDYVCVDLQHGAADYSDLVGMVQAIQLVGGIPIARAPWNDHGTIGRILDAGCHGVIVPMVNTAAQAEAVVTACRYAPNGQRSWGPTLAARNAADYRSWADQSIAAIPMIETVEALSNLDDILATPGIDAIYVGPADLAISLGLGATGNDGTPIFDDALHRIVEACQRHGVVPGIHGSASVAALRRSQGFRMITIASDIAEMRAGIARSAKQARGE